VSYDIYLGKAACVTCGHVDHADVNLPNPTYNLTPIFDFALTGEPLPNEDVSEALVVLHHAKTDRPRGLRILNGRTGRDTLKQLNAALFALSDDPEKLETFRKLQPPNGWGTLSDARSVMKTLRDAAENHPDHVWEIQ
jgi:hypothetical protein